MHQYLFPLLLLMLSRGISGLVTRQLWEFPGNIWIENLATRPNGHLLLNTFYLGSIDDFDPNSPSTPPRLIAQLPGASGLTGIAELEPDFFAVTGGQLNTSAFRFLPGSLNVYTIDFRDRDTCGNSDADKNSSSQYDEPVIRTLVNVADTSMLNGMLSLPEYPHIILSVDSVAGQIFRIDTHTAAINVVLQHPILGLSDVAGRVPPGANGIKLHNGYMYFTNSAQRIFGRVRLNAKGDEFGTPEVMADISASEPSTVTSDDFCFDLNDNAFIARHPNALAKIERDGTQTIVVGGGNSTVLRSPNIGGIGSRWNQVIRSYGWIEGRWTNWWPGGRSRFELIFSYRNEIGISLIRAT
jgi:hypothetical protein